MFPVTINIENDTTATIELLSNELIKLNKVLLFAYATQKHLNIDDLETEFDDLKSSGLKNVEDVINYLKKFDINIRYTPKTEFVPFEAITNVKANSLEVENYCVLGRFPLTNSIYNDYEVLEKKLAAEKVNRFIKELPKNYKDVVFLRIYADLPFSEIAANLGISENSAKVIFYRAKKILKEAIKNDTM